MRCIAIQMNASSACLRIHSCWVNLKNLQNQRQLHQAGNHSKI